MLFVKARRLDFLYSSFSSSKSAINKFSFKGKLVELRKSKMKEIVRKAFEVTPRGGIVLLSPAAASFDMFKDYKDRGYQFKEAVKNIK